MLFYFILFFPHYRKVVPKSQSISEDDCDELPDRIAIIFSDVSLVSQDKPVKLPYIKIELTKLPSFYIR